VRVFRQMRWMLTQGHRRVVSSPCSSAAGTCVFHETSAAAYRHAASTRTSDRISPSDSRAAAAAGQVAACRLCRPAPRSTIYSSLSPVRCRDVQTAACEPSSAPPTASLQMTTRRSWLKTCPVHKVDTFHRHRHLQVMNATHLGFGFGLAG